MLDWIPIIYHDIYHEFKLFLYLRHRNQTPFVLLEWANKQIFTNYFRISDIFWKEIYLDSNLKYETK